MSNSDPMRRAGDVPGQPLTASQLKRRRKVQRLNEAARAVKAAELEKARAVCPTPDKVPYRLSDTAADAAQAMADKSGRAWMAYRCVCQRWHVRPVR